MVERLAGGEFSHVVSLPSVEVSWDDSVNYTCAAYYSADQFKHLYRVNGFPKQQERNLQAFGGLGEELA